MRVAVYKKMTLPRQWNMLSSYATLLKSLEKLGIVPTKVRNNNLFEAGLVMNIKLQPFFATR